MPRQYTVTISESKPGGTNAEAAMGCVGCLVILMVFGCCGGFVFPMMSNQSQSDIKPTGPSRPVQPPAPVRRATDTHVYSPPPTEIPRAPREQEVDMPTPVIPVEKDDVAPPALRHDSPTLGTLVLKFVGPDARIGQDLELFIDGKVVEPNSSIARSSALSRAPTLPGNSADPGTSTWDGVGFGMKELRLPTGGHSILLKKHGIEVFSNDVNVKHSSDGKTFLDVKLVVAGTVLVKNSEPVTFGWLVQVCVDQEKPGNSLFGPRGHVWREGADSVEINVDSGTRQITVYGMPSRTVLRNGVYVYPNEWLTLESFTVDVRPGEQTVVTMKKSSSGKTRR